MTVIFLIKRKIKLHEFCSEFYDNFNLPPREKSVPYSASFRKVSKTKKKIHFINTLIVCLVNNVKKNIFSEITLLQFLRSSANNSFSVKILSAYSSKLDYFAQSVFEINTIQLAVFHCSVICLYYVC